jgi:hypothetical protein
MVPGDTLLVVESGNLQFFKPDSTFIRSTKNASTVVSIAPFLGQYFLVRGRLSTPDGIARPLHVLDHNGLVLRSFGDGFSNTTIAAPTSGASAWVAWMDRYELVHIDTAGKVLARLQRNAPWLPADRPSYWDYKGPPLPSLSALRVASDGLLWLLGHEPGPRWREAIPEIRSDGTIDPTRMQIEVLRNSVVEVMDPRAGRLVATAKFPGYIVGFVGDDRVLATLEDARGIPRAPIWKMILLRG